jgi:hypothetical protein
MLNVNLSPYQKWVIHFSGRIPHYGLESHIPSIVFHYYFIEVQWHEQHIERLGNVMQLD